MAISAYILKIVAKDPFLRLQMRAKEMFNGHHFFLSRVVQQLKISTQSGHNISFQSPRVIMKPNSMAIDRIKEKIEA